MWLVRLQKMIRPFKIATPIRITPEMNQAVDEIIRRLERLQPGDVPEGEPFYESTIGDPPVPFCVRMATPLELLRRLPGSGAGAVTPAWSNAVSGLTRSKCEIILYSELPIKWARTYRNTLLHELVHCIDPKLNKRELYDAKWHRRHRERMNMPNYTERFDYFSAPWEQDAYMSSMAYDQVSMWKRNGVEYMRAVRELQNHLPEFKAERWYSEHPQLWRRYLQALWQAVEDIYADERPINQQQRRTLEQAWYHGNPTSV